MRLQLHHLHGAGDASDASTPIWFSSRFLFFSGFGARNGLTEAQWRQYWRIQNSKCQNSNFQIFKLHGPTSILEHQKNMIKFRILEDWRKKHTYSPLNSRSTAPLRRLFMLFLIPHFYRPPELLCQHAAMSTCLEKGLQINLIPFLLGDGRHLPQLPGLHPGLGISY